MRRRVMLLISLIAKDWQVFLADRPAALLGFAAPVLVASIVAAVVTGFAGKDSVLDVGIVSRIWWSTALMMLLYRGIESGVMLLRERRHPLWSRVRSSPVPLRTLLLAKGFATASISFLQTLVLFGFGTLVLGVSVAGSWFGFLLVAGAVSLLTSVMGLLLAALVETEAHARSIGWPIILVVSLLGMLPGWVSV